LRDRNDWSGFDLIIRRLLTEYYDPMYNYQRERSERTVVFAGTQAEILDWLRHQDGQPQAINP
ncbi:MAG: hypothetical protein WED11_00810, partial [Natronospirillum sp.]